MEKILYEIGMWLKIYELFDPAKYEHLHDSFTTDGEDRLKCAAKAKQELMKAVLRHP